MSKEKLNKHFKTRNHKERLPVEITDAERLEFAQTQARIHSEIEAAEDRKKEVAKSFDSEIATLEGQLNKVVGIVNAGYEYREVACVTTTNYDTRTIEAMEKGVED